MKKTSSEREILWGRLALCMGGDHRWIERPEAAMNEVLWMLHAKTLKIRQISKYETQRERETCFSKNQEEVFLLGSILLYNEELSYLHK